MILPTLTQFRVEPQTNGLVHLVFDCPGRTMNVFSNAAIHELGAFAAWLAEADVKGVLIRSGKDNAFCAGADLSELGVAYDMIMEAMPRDRFNVAFDHFFPLSKAIRALETAGKPVAAAIAGLALGGGCELALGAHYRVLVDDPKIGMGLPESLVGLLPGAGGTQRLPRLVGVDVALPILLDGGRLSGNAALEAGLVHELAAAGDEIARAEAWLLSARDAAQPWDRAGWQSPSVMPLLGERRASADPHNPAFDAIPTCVEFGLPQSSEGANPSEMAIFAALIQRPEPRNMIQILFLGKTDYDRALRKGALPDAIPAIVEVARSVRGDKSDAEVLRAISAASIPFGSGLSFEEKRMADYACITQAGFPAYLGGPFTFAERGFA